MKDCENCAHKQCCYILAKGIFCEEEVKERQIDCPYMPIIVKCRDCYFYNEICEYCIVNSNLSYGDLCYEGNDFYFYVDADDYCSRARRKEEEE